MMSFICLHFTLPFYSLHKKNTQTWNRACCQCILNSFITQPIEYRTDIVELIGLRTRLRFEFLLTCKAYTIDSPAKPLSIVSRLITANSAANRMTQFPINSNLSEIHLGVKYNTGKLSTFYMVSCWYCKLFNFPNNQHFWKIVTAVVLVINIKHECVSHFTKLKTVTKYSRNK